MQKNTWTPKSDQDLNLPSLGDLELHPIPQGPIGENPPIHRIACRVSQMPLSSVLRVSECWLHEFHRSHGSYNKHQFRHYYTCGLYLSRQKHLMHGQN